MAAVLVDTNVLVYLFDRDEPRKRARAIEVVDSLVTAGEGCVSTQILGEFFVVTSSKLESPLPVAVAAEQVSRFAELFEVYDVDVDVVRTAVRGVVEHGFSYHDAQVWAVARIHHFPVVLTEDFQDGRIVEGVTFRDPFAARFCLQEVLS